MPLNYEPAEPLLPLTAATDHLATSTTSLLHCRVWGGLMRELDYKGASRNPCFKCIGAEMGRGDHLVCSEFGRDHSQ